MDKSLIPPGPYCYWIKEIQDQEILGTDIEYFGKDLREYPYAGNYKEILCPYYHRTDYGTVRCEYVDEEYLDGLDDQAAEKIIQHFGTDKVLKERFPYDDYLSDEIKICGINLEEK